MRDLLGILERTGFLGAEFLGRTAVSTSKRTHGAIFRARKPERPAGVVLEDAVSRLDNVRAENSFLTGRHRPLTIIDGTDTI